MTFIQWITPLKHHDGQWFSKSRSWLWVYLLIYSFCDVICTNSSISKYFLSCYHKHDWTFQAQPWSYLSSWLLLVLYDASLKMSLSYLGCSLFPSSHNMVDLIPSAWTQIEHEPLRVNCQQFKAETLLFKKMDLCYPQIWSTSLGSLREPKCELKKNSQLDHGFLKSAFRATSFSQLFCSDYSSKGHS